MSLSVCKESVINPFSGDIVSAIEHVNEESSQQCIPLKELAQSTYSQAGSISNVISGIPRQVISTKLGLRGINLFASSLPKKGRAIEWSAGFVVSSSPVLWNAAIVVGGLDWAAEKVSNYVIGDFDLS